jgi:dUTP pyrophosphatase
MNELLISLVHPDAKAPQRTRAHDAGYDLFSVEPTDLAPGERAAVDTGVAIALPVGVAGLVVPRSGLAAKHGLSVVNAPGLIDAGYRGTLRVLLVNLGPDRFEAPAGSRIAQLLLTSYLTPSLRSVDVLPDSGDERGDAGFGSSGLS